MNIDRLPTEIIRRIATFLSCQDSLMLMKTSWQFHEILKDRLLFKNKVEPRTLLHMNAIPTLSSKPTADNFSLWARLALADQRVSDLANLPPPAVKPSDIKNEDDLTLPKYNTNTTKLMSVIPQLMASYHPTASSLDPISLMAPFIHLHVIPASPDLRYALDFCLSYLVLGHVHRCKAIAAPVDAEIDEIVLLLETYNILVPDITGTIPSTRFMCKLVPFLRAYHASPAPPLRINPPSGASIPYTSFMDLPLLFSSTATQDFQRCFSASRSDPSFLSSGKWGSYYSLSMDMFDEPIRNFQPPVTDVQFSLATEETWPGLGDGELPAGCSLLTATGDDSFGLFTARGVLRPDGQIEMIEINYRGQEWVWILKVCPFGLFGTWGTLDEVNGYLWMFKEDWAFREK